LCSVASFRRSNAALNLLLPAKLPVQAHLFINLSIEAPATKQHQEPSAEFA
jgi:hypothetical protein